MSKKDFIALADMIRNANRYAVKCHQPEPFGPAAIAEMATFCKSQNYSFMRDRWLSYIAGECGPNGGTIKQGNSGCSCGMADKGAPGHDHESA